MAQEGQTAIGPNGERAVFRGGQWVVMSQAPQMPADPTFAYQGPKAAAEVDNTRANARVNTVQASVAEATAPAVIAKTNAEADKAAAEAARIERERAAGRPTLSPEAYATAMAQASGARGLTAIIKDLEDKYKAGPGGTSGLRGLRDYFPGEGNERFDTAANSARGTVAKALGFTGGQLNSAVEAKFNLGAYIPQSGNFDGTIEDTIARLKQLQQDAFKGAVATLGGVPDANGRITPIPEGVPLNAMTIPRIVAGEKLTAAEFGATTGVKPLPPEIQQAHAQLVQRLIAEGGGRIDPQAYVQGRAELLAGVPGFEDNDPAANAAWAERLNNYFEQGGKTVPGDIASEEKPLSTVDWGRNALVNNLAGAAGVGYLDMMGMGGVTALAPEQTDALANARPLATALGNIGGAIGGTSLIGKGIGATVGGAITPRMSAYGRMKFGRNGVTVAKEVGTDALYSGIYGGVTGDNPLEAAAWGLGGSIGGRAAGKTLGATVGGVTASAPVQALRERGIPLTVGQSLGGFAKNIEDKATSIPVIGDIINARRLEGLQAFNREAFDEAGRPIGARVRSYGQEGLTDLLGPDGSGGGATGRAYDAATAGVRVPLDAQFAQDFAQVGAAGQRLPDDLRGRFGLALNNRVQPIADAGELTGDSYQQSVRGLKSYKAENVKPGFEEDYRDALSGAINTLKSQMQRGGGQSVVDGLERADIAYRSSKTLQDAVGRAKGGSASGEMFTFTPSQLQGAIAKTQNKFPGAHPLSGLANDGQAVLPSQVPDSGTAGRMANMAMGGGLLTGGTAIGGTYGATTGDGQNVGSDAAGGAAAGGLSAATLLAALAIGGTKRGQKALQKGLLDRPDALRTTGSYINTRRGLFGRAALPFVLSPAWTE